MPEWRDRFDELLACRDAAAVVDLLGEHFLEYRRFFYGWSQDDFDSVKFEYEIILYDLLSGPLAGISPRDLPGQIQGLLVLFGSFFERGGMYAALNQVGTALPDSAANHELRALYIVRSVADVAEGYLDCMDAVVTLLRQAVTAEDELSRLTCSWILMEYVSVALVNLKQRDFMAKAAELSSRLDGLCEAGALAWVRDCSALPTHSDSGICLQNKIEEAHRNTVEGLFDQACSLAGFSNIADIEPEEGELAGIDETVALPRYLEEALFEEHNARYQQIPNAVLQGLGADADQNRIYLGTYFPRSYLESFNIARELLRVDSIRNALLRHKSLLNILDVGSGTGGTLCGLLQALHDSGYRGRYKILSVDGNQGALDHQARLLATVAGTNSMLMDVSQECVAFPTTLAACQRELTMWHPELDGAFDIIVSWKFISEFYNANYSQALGVAGSFVNRFAQLAKESGLCILADVTCKDAGNHEWLPITLNREIYASTGGDNRLRCVVPLSCLHWAHECKSHRNCYTQRSFRVSHQQVDNELSRICYRVLANEALAQQVQAALHVSPEYWISANNICRQGVFMQRDVRGAHDSAYAFE